MDFEDSLGKSFQEIFNRIDNWISAESVWVIESNDGEYVNFSVLSQLSGTSYVELPDDLNKSKKSLINIKNDDNKCFPWRHIRHWNTLETHPEGITKQDRQMIKNLDYGHIKFPASKKDYVKIEKKNSICINVFNYENDLAYPVHVSDEKFHVFMDLFVITNSNNSHYVYIKDFNRFTCNKNKT